VRVKKVIVQLNHGNNKLQSMRRY